VQGTINAPLGGMRIPLPGNGPQSSLVSTAAFDDQLGYSQKETSEKVS